MTEPSAQTPAPAPAPASAPAPAQASGPASVPARGLADRLVLGGGVVFVAGLLALALAMVLFAKNGSAPGVVAAFALLGPIGFAISFAGLVVQARERRRS